jgi:ABC-type Fe3+-hydroxamate transport system substrate-binding protein
MKYGNLSCFVILTLGVFITALFPPAIVKPEKSSETRIEDMSNRQVAIEAPAGRVIIFPPVAWDYVTVDEGPEHILAMSNFMRKEMGQGLLGHIYTASSRIPAAPTNGINSAIPQDPESLLLARADAILSWAHFSGHIEKAGLPVVEIKALDSRDAMPVLCRLIASMCGKSKRGERLIAHYLQKRDEVKVKVADLKVSKKPTALFLWVVAPNSIYVVGGDSYYSRSLQVAGAQNLARDFKFGNIDMEQLLLLDPDVFFLGCTFGLVKEPRFFNEQPQWQPLSAVRNRRVYKQPMGSARMEGPVDEPLLQLWMAELLYPNEMPATFRKEFKAAYGEAYHYTLSDDEIDRSIFLDANRLSAGYDRFVRTEAAVPGIEEGQNDDKPGEIAGYSAWRRP